MVTYLKSITLRSNKSNKPKAPLTRSVSGARFVLVDILSKAVGCLTLLIRERNTMPKKAMFNKLDDVSRSLISENLAWAVANKSSWKVVAAAKLCHEINLQDADRPQYSNVMLDDAAKELMVEAATILEGAELDGVETTILENAMVEGLATCFKLNTKAMKALDFSNEAFDRAVVQPDYFKKTKEERLVVIAELQDQLTVAESKRMIEENDARKEYRDIADQLVRRILNAPDAANAISGNGEYDPYLEARENAFTNRMKSLRGGSTIIDGEWKNRYDRKGQYQKHDADTMDGHFTILLDNAIKLGIDVAEFEAMPTLEQREAERANIRS
jgi:hypothetical protein